MNLATTDVRVLVMAGGTGGHVFPALAVAHCLRKQGARVQWLGAVGGMESSLVPQHGFDFHGIAITGLRGNGVLGWLCAPWRVFRATCAAHTVLRKMRANVVLGMGGFASGPGGLAAWLARRPLVIHEQNAIAGLTNRILARFADRILEAFPASFSEKTAARHTGNPVRESIAAVPAPALRFAARKQQYLNDDRTSHNEADGAQGGQSLHLLVLGGSQGAQVINEVVPCALNLLGRRAKIRVRHQAGERHLQSTCRAYNELGLAVQPVAFIKDMASNYAWADLVLCRAGAMTVAELAAVGVASILVPFPHAVDDHQSANARYLSEVGAAALVPQPQFTPASLATMLEEFSQKPVQLLAMAEAARSRAITDACERVAQHCLEVARV